MPQGWVQLLDYPDYRQNICDCVSTRMHSSWDQRRMVSLRNASKKPSMRPWQSSRLITSRVKPTSRSVLRLM
jgi:hypothetical protein